MEPLIVDISDSPLTHIKRRALFKKFTWDTEEGAPSMSIEVVILRYVNEAGEYGELIPDSLEYPIYRRLFVANNATRLNPQTGEIIEGDDQSAGVGEYDGFIYKMSQKVTQKSTLEEITEEIVGAILKADSRGQLNV